MINENNLIIYGQLMSKFECKNFECPLNKELIDDIDDSATFARNESCHHYSIKMIRKIKNRAINITISATCQNCNKTESNEYTDMTNTFFFQCCNQKEFIFTYEISLMKEEQNLFYKPSNKNNKFEGREKNLIENNEDDNLFDDNNSYINDKKDSKSMNEDLISENSENRLNKNNISLKKTELFPFQNIAEENKILLIFKYYKKTEENCFIYCSKSNHLSDIIKEFKNKFGIKKITYAFCDGKKLDGERTIKEIKLKNKSIILLK